MANTSGLSQTTLDYLQFLTTHPDYKPLVSSSAIYRALKTVDMGPAPPTTKAGTFRMVLRYTGPNGVIAENVLYGQSGQYTGTQAQVTAVANGLMSVMIGPNSLLQLISSHWTLVSAICQDNSGTGNFYAVAGSHPGSDPATGNSCPPNTAAVISWDVDQRYQGGHPRTYLPGIAETNLSTPGGNEWTANFTGLLKTVGKQFLDALVAQLVSQLTSAAVGTLSRRANYVWKTPPDFWPYVDTKSHPRVDTQRRRLGKEITAG